jgi:hypothetical protein
VPDEQEVRLVVLGPENSHSGKTTDSPARVTAQALLDKRAAGDRLHRNMLVFLAPDTARLADLHQAVREFLAWRSIEAEKETLNLDNFQTKQAETKCAQFDEAVLQRINETFVWVLVPSQSPSDTEISWEETRVSGSEPLAVRVGKKLRNEEALITEYSGARLRMDLDRADVPLWRGEHVGLKQLWSDYTQYLYLPRLRDSAVLLDAIRSGVALLTWNPDSFAYASAFDDKTNRYSGLIAGQHAAVVLDPASVLVKPQIAARQMDDDRLAASESSTRTAESEAPEASGPGDGTTVTPPADRPPSAPKRFYGRVSLEPVRMLRDLGDIADAIVGQLGRADAEVSITVEVEATAEGGFSDDIRRTVSENARTLKFETHEFED